MVELILGVIVNVLGHVCIEDTQGSGIGCAATPAWDFAVLDAAELVVLLSQVRFERFEHSKEPENRGVAWRETVVGESQRGTRQQPRADGPGSCTDQERATAGGRRGLVR